MTSCAIGQCCENIVEIKFNILELVLRSFEIFISKLFEGINASAAKLSSNFVFCVGQKQHGSKTYLTKISAKFELKPPPYPLVCQHVISLGSTFNAL